MTDHRVSPCEVVNAGRVVRRRFQKGGGQIGDVHRAADVVGEQDAVEFVQGGLSPTISGVRATTACGCGSRQSQPRSRS
ncbi:hypothetical protein [Streptomyces sp. NPDC002671]